MKKLKMKTVLSFFIFIFCFIFYNSNTFAINNVDTLFEIQKENVDGYKYIKIIEEDIMYLQNVDSTDVKITKEITELNNQRRILVENGYDLINGIKLYYPSESAAIYTLDELILHRKNLIQNKKAEDYSTKSYLDAMSNLEIYKGDKEFSVNGPTEKISNKNYKQILLFLNEGYLPESYRLDLNIYLVPFKVNNITGFYQDFPNKDNKGDIVIFGESDQNKDIVGTFYHEIGHRISNLDAKNHTSGNSDIYWLEYMKRYGINDLNDIKMSWNTSPKESYAEDTKAYLKHIIDKEEKIETIKNKKTIYPMIKQNFEELESIFQLEKRFKLISDEFNKVEISDWAKEPFQSLSKEIDIPSKSSYKVNATRKEFTELMVQSYAKTNEINLENVKPAKNFNDTNNQYILKARQLGIVDGVGYNNFKPNEKITREDAMVMIYKATKVKPKTDQEILFEDHHQISDYAKEAVGAMLSYEIVAGKETNKFYPQDTIKLEEAVKIFDSFLKTF